MGDLQQERAELAEKCRAIQDAGNVDVRLNGKPAAICGFRNQFGNVYSMDEMLGAEWSWHAIHQVLTRKKDPGAFQS